MNTLRPTVSRIQSFPLEYVLPDGGHGASKSRPSARTATLVKLTTSDGVVGWGESFGPPRLVAEFIRTAAQSIIGRPLDLREGHWLDQLTRSYHLTAAGAQVLAFSGIDQAMWDAQARTYGVPVSALLGGAMRDSVTAYASTGFFHAGGDAGPLRDYMQSAVDEGFTAAKIKIGSGLTADVERVDIARELLGDDGLLMVDYNTNATADVAIRSLAAIAPFGIYWAEEPVLPDDTTGWPLLRASGVPLAAGEALYTRRGFRDPISKRLIDIAQPNLSVCGGFTEAKAIATLASAFDIRVAPHVWGTGVLLGATLQFLSALPATPFGEHNPYPPLLEFDRGENPLRDGVLLEPITAADGVVAISDGPGIGVTVDEPALAQWLVASHAFEVTA